MTIERDRIREEITGAISQLKSDNSDDRREALTILQGLGEQAMRGILELKEVLKSGDIEACTRIAIGVFGHINPSRELSSELLELLRVSPKGLNSDAVIGALVSSHEPTVLKEVERIAKESKDKTYRSAFFRQIGAAGAAASYAIPYLMESAISPMVHSQFERSDANISLKRIVSDVKEHHAKRLHELGATDFPVIGPNSVAKFSSIPLSNGVVDNRLRFVHEQLPSIVSEIRYIAFEDLINQPLIVFVHDECNVGISITNKIEDVVRYLCIVHGLEPSKVTAYQFYPFGEGDNAGSTQNLAYQGSEAHFVYLESLPTNIPGFIIEKLYERPEFCLSDDSHSIADDNSLRMFLPFSYRAGIGELIGSVLRGTDNGYVHSVDDVLSSSYGDSLDQDCRIIPKLPRKLDESFDLIVQPYENAWDNTLEWESPIGDIHLVSSDDSCKVTNVARTVHKGSDVYNWGYEGSGPSELAANILNQFVPPESDGLAADTYSQSYAEGIHQNKLSRTAIILLYDFARDLLADLPQSGHVVISGERIRDWILAKVPEMQNRVPRELHLSQGS